MRTFEYRSNSQWMPRGALEDGAGLYRLRQGGYAIWPAPGRGPRKRFYNWIVPRLVVSCRLFVPVLLLTVLLGTIYLYADLPLAAFSNSPYLLAVSDLILPIAFLSINLTNRRYGADYAFLQLIAGMAICAGVMLFHPSHMDDWLQTPPVLTTRTLASFAAAFFLANAVGIGMFELARGPGWWLSPLVGSIATSVTFSAVFYAASMVGLRDNWGDLALAHSALYVAESIALLIPYSMLRASMPPLHGLNGY